MMTYDQGQQHYAFPIGILNWHEIVNFETGAQVADKRPAVTAHQHSPASWKVSTIRKIFCRALCRITCRLEALTSKMLHTSSDLC